MIESTAPDPAAAPGTGSEPGGRDPAGFGRRFAALVIDSVLAALVATAFTYPAAPQFWSAVVLFMAYTFFTGLYSQTIGMRLMKIGVVSVTTGGPIGIPRAALRAALLQLLIPAAILDRDGRGWHDKAAGSIVVR